MIITQITTKSGKVYYLSDNGLTQYLSMAKRYLNTKQADDDLDCAFLQAELGDLLEYDGQDYQYTVKFVNWIDPNDLFVIVDESLHELLEIETGGFLPPMKAQDIMKYFNCGGADTVEELTCNISHKIKKPVKLYLCHKDKFCSKCGRPVVDTDTPEKYSCQCFYCDEDFYDCETSTRPTCYAHHDLLQAYNLTHADLIKIIDSVSKYIGIGGDLFWNSVIDELDKLE